MIKTRKKAASSDGDTGNGCGVEFLSHNSPLNKHSKTASPLMGGRGYAASNYRDFRGERQEVSGKKFFEIVKERVTMSEVVRFYGFQPNRAGFIQCPFHANGNEKTPSLKIYDRNFHCFGCQTGGDAVKFLELLYNLKPLEAVKRLNDDLRLGLNLERHAPTKAERKEADKRLWIKTVQEAFIAWQGKADEQLSACIFMANEALKRKTPDKWTEFEIMAIKHQAELEYYADILLWDDMNAKFELFQMRKEIDALCEMILQV